MEISINIKNQKIMYTPNINQNQQPSALNQQSLGLPGAFGYQVQSGIGPAGLPGPYYPTSTYVLSTSGYNVPTYYPPVMPTYNPYATVNPYAHTNNGQLVPTYSPPVMPAYNPYATVNPFVNTNNGQLVQTISYVNQPYKTVSQYPMNPNYSVAQVPQMNYPLNSNVDTVRIEERKVTYVDTESRESKNDERLEQLQLEYNDLNTTILGLTETNKDNAGKMIETNAIAACTERPEDKAYIAKNIDELKKAIKTNHKEIAELKSELDKKGSELKTYRSSKTQQPQNQSVTQNDVYSRATENSYNRHTEGRDIRTRALVQIDVNVGYLKLGIFFVILLGILYNLNFV